MVIYLDENCKEGSAGTSRLAMLVKSAHGKLLAEGSLAKKFGPQIRANGTQMTDA